MHERGVNVDEPGSSRAVVARGIRKTFEAENSPIRALRGADLEVHDGEFVAKIVARPGVVAIGSRIDSRVLVRDPGRVRTLSFGVVLPPVSHARDFLCTVAL